MTTHDPNEKRFIEQINTLLDASAVDADERKALQQARMRALQAYPKRGAPLPWMAFALSAALAAVLVVNLPGKTPVAVNQAKTPANTTAKPSKPAVNNTATKSASASALELDLIENLELYEDAEFYQWLSEQSEQGAHDA